MSNHFVRGLKHYKYEVKKMFIFDEYLSFVLTNRTFMPEKITCYNQG